MLIDTGSTHNFVSSQVVDKLQLPVVGNHKLTVKVANGEVLPCQGVCNSLFLELPSYRVSGEFFVIPLAGVDVVLGIEWLKGLYSISWNFQKMVMSFDQIAG